MSTQETTGTLLTLGAKKTAPGFPVRFSYAYVEKAKLSKKPKAGEKPKFSVQIIVDKKSPDVAAINAAMQAAAKANKATAGVDYDTLELILRDGDNPKDNKKKQSHLFGKFFLNASCGEEYPPDVVGRFKDPATDKLERLVKVETKKTVGADGKTVETSERKIVRGADGLPKFKSGDFGVVTVNFYGYTGEQTGVSAGLRNIQKVLDGESLAGLSSADDDFEAEEEDDDDDFMK